jgi:hypothetical protein
MHIKRSLPPISAFLTGLAHSGQQINVGYPSLGVITDCNRTKEQRLPQVSYSVLPAFIIIACQIRFLSEFQISSHRFIQGKHRLDIDCLQFVDKIDVFMRYFCVANAIWLIR